MTSLVLQTSNKTDGNMSFMYGSKEEVQSNRRNFLETFGFSIEDCAVMEAEHEDSIVHVDSSNKGAVIKAEAFITNEKNVILFLLTGDCYPVCFFDPVQEVVALAHLGWKPTDKNLPRKVVQEIVTKYASIPKDIQVFLGPGIHKESYVFPNPVQKDRDGWLDFLTELPTGEFQIDILGHIQKQLHDEGIIGEHVSTSPIDTGVSDEYWSYYRANKTGQEDGRFVTIVGLV